jgi:hypothetical protein
LDKEESEKRQQQKKRRRVTWKKVVTKCETLEHLRKMQNKIMLLRHENSERERKKSRNGSV